MRLEYRRRKPHQRQFVCARQTGGPCANYRHFTPTADALAAWIAQFGIDAAEIEVVRFSAELFTDKPFQSADRDGCVERSAPAFRLARSGTHTAADRGKRVRRAGDDIGVLVTPFGYGLHIAAGVRVNRTSLAAEDLPVEIAHVRQFDRIGYRHYSKLVQPSG